MKRKLRYLLVLAALVCFTGSVQAISYTTLDYPGAVETYITGIDGDTIVGFYSNYKPTGYIDGYPRNRELHSFVYDGQTWTTLDCPRVLESPSGRLDRIYVAKIEGIDNGKIVGNCRTFYHGYCGSINDGQNWTLLNFPGAQDTYIQAIDGSNIAGSYYDSTGLHGFVYDGTNWTTLLYPWIDSYTRVAGISGNNVAIFELNYVNGLNSVIYNLDSQSWNTIKFPGSQNTMVLGIDGSNIFGAYGEGEGFQHYFLYDGSSWTNFDCLINPRLGFDVITDMDGDNIVGYYIDGTGVHGFIAIIPEPATLALLALGGLTLTKKKNNKQNV